MGNTPEQAPARISAVDVYRGLVMFLMMAEELNFGKVAQAVRDQPIWTFLAHQQSHVKWAGCNLHDLIQPSFSFLVGVAVPFSLASRLARGQSVARLLFHAAWRALVLVLLGIFLRSTGHSQTNFNFEDTLGQIGLGYLPLVLIALGPRWLWWSAVGAIVVGYWAAFGLYPLPGPTFDYAAVGVPANWMEHYTGFAAHWNKNSNLAWAFDTWFLNLFPRAKPFLFNEGGYSTLSFIPTLGTMILGLIAGDWLKRGGPTWATVGRLLLTGAICLGLGYAADVTGICPSVKRIWTSSWVMFSGGWCFLILAGFYAVCDIWQLRAWSYPLRVIGANSIVAYLLAHMHGAFIVGVIRTHFGPGVFTAYGPAYESLLKGAATLLFFWLILAWMYHRRIYVRI